MKKKINILFSTMLVLNLPILSISCIKKPDTMSNKSSEQQSKSELEQEDIIKDLNTMCNGISHKLKQGIDGSGFTPSQSMADIVVQQDIVKKIKTLCCNPQHIKFIPKFKSQYFKAGDENYVDVEIVCIMNGMQTSLLHKDLQIRNIKQNLEELINQTVKSLEDLIDCTNAFLMEDDDLQEREIENRFINVLKNKLEHDDERIQLRLVDKNEPLRNMHKLELEIIGQDDNNDSIIKNIEVTPVNLVIVDEYRRSLVDNIPNSSVYQIFADYPTLGWGNSFETKIKEIFNQQNGEVLGGRGFKKVDFINKSEYSLKIRKGWNKISLEINPRFNKRIIPIAFTLSDVKNHPQYIISEVAKHFEYNRIDLTNEPVFSDSAFNSDEIKIKIEEAIKKTKKSNRWWGWYKSRCEKVWKKLGSTVWV